MCQVMGLMELTSLKGSLVGLPGQSGLSVEQRKRLTIGVELVANPSIIFMVLFTSIPDMAVPLICSAALTACLLSVSLSITLPFRPCSLSLHCWGFLERRKCRAYPRIDALQDEPTSGLDARAAAIVMRTVRNTVNTGRTVVCTIHQPSIDIFEVRLAPDYINPDGARSYRHCERPAYLGTAAKSHAGCQAGLVRMREAGLCMFWDTYHWRQLLLLLQAFDELLLLKRGGRAIYCGPTGHESQQLIDYFEAHSGVQPIPEGTNPASWMLEVSPRSL